MGTGGFFTRPDLEDRQFRQFSGSTLTLSGETNFAGILKSKNVEIDATATNIGDVLTFDGTKIVLSPNASGGTTGVYSGATPSNIVVGGMGVGTTLTGRTFSSILEEILITTLIPTISPPSNTFTDVIGNTYEVGNIVPLIRLTATFNQGLITPLYDATGTQIAPNAPRSGLPSQYNYTTNTIDAIPTPVLTTSLSDVNDITNYVMVAGSNYWRSNVDYVLSTITAYDSAGGVVAAPLPAGNSGDKQVTFTGIYPYFYGKVASANPRPTAGQALLNTGTKVVATSTGTVNVNYNTTGAEWTWIAIPTLQSPTIKTKWYVTDLSNGIIGGVYPSGNKYPNPDTDIVDSPTALWTGVSYRFYISEGAGIETNIEFRNS